MLNVHSKRVRSLLMLLLSIAVAIAVVLFHGTIAFSQDVGSVTRQITVRVEGAEPGSGVLIGRQANTYYVLTAKHVVRYPDNYAILTPDGSIHPVANLDIRRIPEVDLAILGFTSDRDYTVATVGDSDLATETTSVWVAGFPLPGRENDTPLFHITDGQITARPLIPNSEGYGLTYSNITHTGMSGGPVVNSQGHVIGIHGLSEAEPYTDQEGATIPISGWTNLGIPINIFRTVAPLMEIELALADPNASDTGNDPSDCVAQLRFKDITSTDGPDDDGEWRFPAIVIGPQSDPESYFGPGSIPGSSMQAVGCRIKHSGFLGSTITWRCPSANLRVETMTVAQANAQCNGSAPPDPTPQATARREQLNQQEELLQQLAATCRRFKADYDYWQQRRQTCGSNGACQAEALAAEQEAERQWQAAGCGNEWGAVWSPMGVY